MRLKRFAPAFGHVIEDPKKAISAAIQAFEKTDKDIVKALKKGAKTIITTIIDNQRKTSSENISDEKTIIERECAKNSPKFNTSSQKKAL